MRLLLVEDDKKIARFVQAGLKQSGFSVDHVSNGEDGLFMSLSEPYDLIIADIMLPRLDGLSMIEELRRRKILTLVRPSAKSHTILFCHRQISSIHRILTLATLTRSGLWWRAHNGFMRG